MTGTENICKEKEFRHCFAIPAYRDSPYLETCVSSLLSQERKTDIIICTSTPSGKIKNTAEKYSIPCYERKGKSTIYDDWKFAFEKAVCHNAAYVTLAHQDDIYHPGYVSELVKASEKHADMLLFFTGYIPVDENGKKLSGKAPFVKKLMRLPYHFPFFKNTVFTKKLPLLFGNPICCPTCTYNAGMYGSEIFENKNFVLDWTAFLKLADMKGSFFCTEKELLYYRIHDDAATKKCISDLSREKEESDVFEKLWGKKLAEKIMFFYRKGY